MPYPVSRVWLRAAVPAIAIVIVALTASAHAHVHWNRTNTVGPDTAALYHFDTGNINQTDPAAGLSPGLGLTVYSGSSSLFPVGDIPGSIFAPYSLSLPATQTLRSTDTLAQLEGDLTIECWFKWTSTMTTATLELGLQSGAKILIARDTATPFNDRFGVSATHGSFIPAPGFTNWADIGDEEAGLNEWRHLALAIHSAGIHYDAPSSHDVYSTGTIGRIYLNGHPVGFFPHTIDLTGLKVHDASRVTIIMQGGGMVVDEVAIWRRDFSDNGTAASPFSDGRGPTSGVDQWWHYSDE